MKKLIFATLVITVCGISCMRETACYSAKLPPAPAYSENNYNSVRSILNQYYDPGYRGGINISWSTIYMEDSTVTRLPLKAHGHVFGTYGHRENFCLVSDDPIQDIGYQQYEHFITPDVAAESPHLYEHSLVFISYDTSNHSIKDRLLSLNSADTVYISGRLRLYYTYTRVTLGNPCGERQPGLWIDSAEDISLIPQNDTL